MFNEVDDIFKEYKMFNEVDDIFKEFIDEVGQILFKISESDNMPSLMRNTNLATNLARVRFSSGLTQKQLSEISGVSIRTIQTCEIGQRNINNVSALSVYKLSVALNCPIEVILEI